MRALSIGRKVGAAEIEGSRVIQTFAGHRFNESPLLT
jgi:hypothetical protein